MALLTTQPEHGGTFRVLLFWALSLVVFPYSPMADDVRARREVHRACFLAGAVLVFVGLAWRLGAFGERFRELEPAGESLWLGVALACAGAARLGREPTEVEPAAPAPPLAVRHLACGVASITSGAIWLWLLWR